MIENTTYLENIPTCFSICHFEGVFQTTEKSDLVSDFISI